MIDRGMAVGNWQLATATPLRDGWLVVVYVVVVIKKFSPKAKPPQLPIANCHAVA